MYSFRRQIAETKEWLKRFLPISLLGGLVGSFLLTHTQEKVFAHLVPFLLLFATVIFLSQGFFRRFAKSGAWTGRCPTNSNGLWGAIVFQFLVAVYGGYFGAGIGILMLATLGILGLNDIHQMNALKNILGSVINQVAAIYFIIAGLIDWPGAGIMTVGALGGYFRGLTTRSAFHKSGCAKSLPSSALRFQPCSFTSSLFVKHRAANCVLESSSKSCYGFRREFER